MNVLELMKVIRLINDYVCLVRLSINTLRKVDNNPYQLYETRIKQFSPHGNGVFVEFDDFDFDFDYDLDHEDRPYIIFYPWFLKKYAEERKDIYQLDETMIDYGIEELCKIGALKDSTIPTPFLYYELVSYPLPPLVSSRVTKTP